MKVGIHQPNFAPYIGFFTKIYESDKFILLDNVNYSKGDWHNRNCIVQKCKKNWFTVQTNVSLGQKINEVKIAEEFKVRKLLNTLLHSYSQTPYFNRYYPYIKEILLKKKEYLVDLNVEIINWVCQELSITTEIHLASDLIKDNKAENSTELLINLCKSVNGSSYLSGPKGMDYLKTDLFNQANMNLEFLEINIPQYTQRNNDIDFIPNLSILDLIFNEGPASISYIKSASTISKCVG